MSHRDMRAIESRKTAVQTIIEQFCGDLAQVEDELCFDELEIAGTPSMQISSKHLQ